MLSLSGVGVVCVLVVFEFFLEVDLYFFFLVRGEERGGRGFSRVCMNLMVFSVIRSF